MDFIEVIKPIVNLPATKIFELFIAIKGPIINIITINEAAL